MDITLFLNTVYLDLLSTLCIVVGGITCVENIRLARNGQTASLRWYWAVKGVISGIFAARSSPCSWVVRPRPVVMKLAPASAGASFCPTSVGWWQLAQLA